MPASEFLANPANWRVHPKPQREALRGVLNQIGWVQTVMVNANTGTLIDGHLRIDEALRMGDDTPVPFVAVDLSPEEEALILATLDPLSALAVADKDKLDELLREVQTSDAAVMAMLSELAEKSGLDYGKQPQEAPEPQIDKAAELQIKWQTSLGQLWEIPSKTVPGRCHRLMCGDSTKAEDVGRLMAGEKARLVWTDPPYGVKYGDKLEAANPIAHRVRQIENDNLPAAQLEIFIRSALANAADNSMPGAAIYVACPPGTLLPVLIASFTGSGFDFHWGLIWLKDQLVLGRGDYHFKHENILYGWKPDAAHYFTKDRTQTSVFEVPRPKASEEHPTMKPPALVGMMIENSSQQGDMVYDAFLGSGSTMVAAEQLGRLCYGMEIEPKYVAVSLQRMADMGLEPRLSDG